MRQALPFVLFFMLAAFGRASAEDGEPVPRPQPVPSQAPQSKPDFMFGAPKGSVSIRWSWDVHHAGSDWFDFVQEQLTLEDNDFITRGIAGDVNVAISPRVDIVGSAEYTARETFSEYRDFVDNNRQPINQTTRLRQTTVTGGLRYALTDRGRSIGSIAWLPRRLVPYAGGGAGVLWYSLLQWGDFIDFEDGSVFIDQFPSSGWSPVAYVHGGVDLLMFKRVALNIDVRHQWAAPELDEQVFTGFDPLELSGVRISAGISVLF